MSIQIRTEPVSSTENDANEALVKVTAGVYQVIAKSKSPTKSGSANDIIRKMLRSPRFCIEIIDPE